MSPFHPRMYCVNLGWNWSSGIGEEDLNFVNVSSLVRYFRFYLPMEKGLIVRLNKSLHPRMFSAKFGWNWPCDSGEEEIFWILSFIGNKRGRLYEQIWIPNTRGCFVLSLVDPVVLEMKISSIYFLYFDIILPWKNTRPFIWTYLNSLYPWMLCAKFGWNLPYCSGKEDENVKSLQSDTQMGNQEAHGPYRSPKKTVKIINKYD